MTRVNYVVTGITCGHYARSVTEEIQSDQRGVSVHQHGDR